MKIFNDIRNFINDDSFKILVSNDVVSIINYDEIKDISNTFIKILSNKEISILGNNLSIIKMLDNELLIKGNINEIRFNE